MIIVLGLIFAVFFVVNPSLAGARKSSAVAAAANPSQPDLTGYWLDHTRRGAVEIAKCQAKITNSGTNTRRHKNTLCGRIIWLKDPNDKYGNPLTDQLNARASRRNRKICGLKIIGKVARISKRVYDNGWIYDPEKGKYFDVELTLVSRNILQVKGYKGIKLLSKTFLWRRMKPDQLTPCAM